MYLQAEYLTSYALGQLPEELSIFADSHLKSCISRGASISQWAAGVERHERLGGENRKSPRVPTDYPATLTVLRPEKSGHMETRVLDISKEGLRLRIPQ